MTESHSPSYQPLIPSAQVRTGRLTQADVGLHRLALTRLDGQVCAFNSLCPHQLGNLASGFVHEGAVECPVHGWRFDLRTGAAVYPAGEGLRLRRYAAREEGGVVLVSLEAPVP